MGPTKRQPATNNNLANAKFAGPLRNGLCSTIKREKDVIASVLPLLNSISPFTVAGFVIAIVILAINAMFVAWSNPHVLKEVGKILPSLAYANPPAPVVGITDVFWVVATGAHTGPRIVSRGVGKPVGLISRGCLFIVPAAATLGVASLEGRTRRPNSFSAIAFAGPKGLHSVGIHNPLEREGGQSAKALAGDVVELCHVGIIPPVLCMSKRETIT